MNGLFAGLRALHFASLMAIWGVSLYLMLLQRALGISVPARTQKAAMTTAATLALVTAVLWLLLVTGQMSGDWRAASDPGAIRTVALETRFGHIWLGRIAGLVLLLLLTLWRRSTASWFFALLAGLLLASLGLISHAAASTGLTFLHALNDAVHLLTAGFWMGALLVLMLLIWRHRGRPDELFAPFRLFSLWGVYAVALLVVTGVTNAALIVPVHSISPKSAYADVLAIKIAIALAMIALAVINRSHLLPALRNHENGAVRRLHNNVMVEAVLGAAVIAIVGYLGLMPPD